MKAVIFLAFAQDNFRRLELSSEHDQIRKQVANFGIEPMMAFNVEAFVDIFAKNADFQVFHYGGHGASDAIFTYNSYAGKRLNSQNLVDYLACFSLKLVFLNACDTAQIAQKFQKIGISAIGTNGKIDDDVSVQFAALFYQNLAQGRTLEKAFEQAKKALYLVQHKNKSPNDWQLFATEKGKNWVLKTKSSFSEEFKRISSQSFNQIPDFFAKSNQHIDRLETKQVLDWIDQDIPEKQKPIKFLLGAAGIGKSVIMKDIWKALQEKQIPCLAIKADLEATFFNEDKIRQDFSYQIQSFEKVVILIDQIDALSLSLSANRDSLGNFQKFINQIIDLQNVRIVVSCREYDFNYDSNFFIYRSYAKEEVKKLPIEQVKEVLSRLDSSNTFSVQQQEFLRIPLHLNLYCEVYEQKYEVSTIRQLYKKLCNQKLKGQSLSIECLENRLGDIAQKMDEQQEIKVEFENYDDSTTQTLILQGLLLPNGDYLQFFHQTFFEYIFARAFVKKGQKITDYLQERHQGLFIRSKVKYVLDYLRSYDRKDYAAQISEIISQDAYRFHIKLLVIDILANQEQLEKVEKLFIKKHILSTQFQEIYFSKVRQADSLDYLDSLGEVQKSLYFPNKGLFFSFIKAFPERGLDIFLRTDFEKKDELAKNIIHFEGLDFSTKAGMNFIRQYKDIIIEDNKSLGDFYILQKIISTNPALASRYVFEFFKKRIDFGKKIIEHDDSKTFFEEFFKQSPDFAYKLAIQCLDYFHDYLVQTQPYMIGLRSEEELAQMLLDYLRSKMESDFDFIKTEINKFCSSPFPIFPFVAYEIMLEKPELFTTQLFENITQRQILMVGYEAVSSRVLESLKIVEIFDKKQQKKIADAIRKVKSDDDKPRIYDRKIYNRIDHSLHKILQCLPLSFRKEFGFHLQTQELERRFGKFVSKKVSYGSQSVISGTSYTLKTTAAHKISFKEWKKSFVKYNSEKKDDDNFFKRKPTLTGISEQFKTQVKANPQHFFPFVKEIMPDLTIHERYKIDALDGLKEANFNPKLFKEAYLLALSVVKDDYPLRSLVWNSEYLTKHQIYEEEVFRFLEKIALDYPISDYLETTDTQNLGQNALMKGINSTKGAAVRSLMNFSEKYTDAILDIYEKLLSEKSIPIKACMIQNLHFLYEYDKQRSLAIFLKLLENRDEALIEVGSQALSYMKNIDFEAFIPFFEETIYSQNSKVIETCTIRLVEAYAFVSNPKAEELLQKLLAYSPLARDKAIWSVFQLLENSNKEVKEKSKKLLYNYLDSEDKELGEIYENGFLHLQETDFNYFLDWLEAYVASNIGQYRGHYFYDYLLKSIRFNAIKCYELAAKFDNHQLSDILQHTQNHLNFIIEVYNTLKDEENQDIKEKIMDTFDKMLQSPETYRELEAILEKSII